MKHTLTLLTILLSTIGFSQYKISVTEGSESLNGANNNAFSVVIYEATIKDVEKAWKQEMKKMKAKVSMKKEMFGDDASLASISSNTFDIYASTKDINGGIKLTVGIDLGGAFLSSKDNGSAANVVKDLLYNVGKETTKAAIRAVVLEEEKTLKNKEKEQETLVKNKEKLEENIKNWEKDIEQAKKDIEQNIKDQETKAKEIELQKKVVKEVMDKESSVK